MLREAREKYLFLQLPEKTSGAQECLKIPTIRQNNNNNTFKVDETNAKKERWGNIEQ